MPNTNVPNDGTEPEGQGYVDQDQDFKSLLPAQVAVQEKLDAPTYLNQEALVLSAVRSGSFLKSMLDLGYIPSFHVEHAKEIVDQYLEARK